jgi:hypothetical protein
MGELWEDKCLDARNAADIRDLSKQHVELEDEGRGKGRLRYNPTDGMDSAG